MTGQIADVYEYNGNRYNIVAIKGTMNFDIHELGFDPVPIHTACWRGYHCIYNITEEGLFLKDLFVNDRNGSLLMEWNQRRTGLTVRYIMVSTFR